MTTYTLGQATLAADQPAFKAADCAFLAQFASKPNWKTVTDEQRAHYQGLRARLKNLSRHVAAAAASGIALDSAESAQNVSGHAAPDMWCCVFPTAAGHR